MNRRIQRVLENGFMGAVAGGIVTEFATYGQSSWWEILVGGIGGALVVGGGTIVKFARRAARERRAVA